MSKNQGLTMNQLAEINAQHVTTIAELEAKCAALAAENAALKESDVPLGAIENGRAFADRLEAYPFECEGGNLNMCSDWQEFLRCFDHLSEWAMHSRSETPATDAFLAEVRAQGVEVVIAYHRERADALHHVDRNNVIRHSMAALDASDVAAQLRQEAQ